MSGAGTRVYVARLAGTAAFDPNGDRVGKVRDAVALLRPGDAPPRVLGLVLEVPTRRRIFVPITRVTSIDPGAVITTGLVNMRRFEQRSGETLVIGEMLDRRVQVRATGETVVVQDVAMEQTRTRDWLVTRVAVNRPAKRFGRRGEVRVLAWDEVTGLAAPQAGQGAANLLAAFDQMRPADLAGVLHELSAKRRLEVAAALDDERLADVLEELDADDQREILEALDSERAADVLEEMGPDDAADLLGELPSEQAETLLSLMEPDEAEDVRRLLSYADTSAGGMMTTEPVILPPSATIAEALALVRNPDLTPALAAMVYVCRPPLETPTGRYLGVAHLQRMLREPPSALVSAVVDSETEPLRPDSEMPDVTNLLATYNLVAAPVVDDAGHLLGAVTVDDLLDHLLGDDWRGRDQPDAHADAEPASGPATQSAEAGRGT